jgi:hypothetical protein
MILFVVGIMYTEWVSSTKTTTLVQNLKGRISSEFAYQFIFYFAQVLHCFVDASFEKKLAFTTDLPNTNKYFSRIAVFE